jgi:hypothetical protein
MINRLIIECESIEEAETVKENAQNRSDQKDIFIHDERPEYYVEGADLDGYVFTDDHGNSMYVQVKDKDDMPRWFEPNGF